MCDVLVISFSDLGRDPRVDRQIAFLGRRWDVTAAGLGPTRRNVAYVGLDGDAPESALARGRRAAALAARRFEAAYWTSADVRRALERLRHLRPRVIVANDVGTLPLALRLAADAGGGRVLFDAHEYAPRQFEDIWWWRWLFGAQAAALCARHIPRVDAMCTVSAGIADRYAADTGVRPVVIRNAPFYAELEPRAVADDRLRMVHFGAADPTRRLEDMIAMMGSLDERFSLDLVLVSPAGDGYVRRLRRLAEGDDRIRFRPPVPMPELTAFANAYDVGVYLLRADNFNRRFALPNKIFEFVQARLAVAVGPSPEMARLVREHGLGVVAADERPESLAAALSGLDAAAVWEYKRRADAAARELSAEREGERLVALVAELMEGHRYPRAPLAR